MRILHVAEALHPRWGGIAEGVYQQSKELVNRGHQVDVLSCEDDDVPRFQAAGIAHHRFTPLWRPWRYSPETSRWLKENINQYDHVILNGLWQHPLAAAGYVASKAKTKLWIMPHGMLDPWFQKSSKQKIIKKTYWHLIETKSVQYSQGLLFTTEAERELASQTYPIAAIAKHVIGYGIEDIATNSQVAPVQNNLLFMSRIHPKKGLDLAIQCINQDPSAALQIAGSGEESYESELRAMSKDNAIQWKGFVSGNEKITTILESDAMILPSHQENFGVIVAESLALSRPVLISNKVNIWREVLADGAGLVCEDTFEGVAQMVKEWCSMPEDEKAKRRVNARKCFEKNFTIKAHVDRLLNVLESS